MSYTILTVDDSPMTRGMIRKTLTMAGLPVERIVEAADGKSGLDAASVYKVDLVFADLNMPIMDGVEMIRRLSVGATKDVPIVVITADSSETRRQELLGMGVKGFLGKPFTPEKLRDLFVSVLGVKQ